MRSPERFAADFSVNQSMGPGSYDPVNGSQNMGYSFSKLERDAPNATESPGPGFYKIPVKFGEQKLYAQPIIQEEFKYV